MKIHVYTLCWNEEAILPYFFKHYETIAEKIFVFDNGSDDNSHKIIKSHPKAVLNHFDTNGESREDEEIKIKNEAWKQSRKTADWVVVCDTDEFLYHYDLKNYLSQHLELGTTIIHPIGYQIISNKFPTTTDQIYYEANDGFQLDKFSKLVAFNPKHIWDMNYGPGCHKANPTGHVVFDTPRHTKLLHYKFLGEEYVIDRFKKLSKRKSAHDITKGYGLNYFKDEEVIRNDFKRFRKMTKKVI